MKLGSKGRARVRTLVLIGGCLAAAAIAVPGVSTATKVVQDVLVTNTADNPVPVAPQGTTEVAGTVNVANQPEPPAPPAQPVPRQFRLVGMPVTREAPTAIETVYTVPEGKLLTVEYAEFHFSGHVQGRVADLLTDCYGSDPRTGSIHAGTYHLPEIQSGDLHRIFGGPIKLLVPAGRCLLSRVNVRSTDIPEGNTIVVHGSVTGYLTDAPAPGA
jgi:hypothetical protein